MKENQTLFIKPFPFEVPADLKGYTKTINLTSIYEEFSQKIFYKGTTFSCECD
jgi:hypothetical protein